MVEVVLNKVFKDNNTGEDVYLLSIKLKDGDIHTIPCTKDEFDMVHLKVKKIYNNNQNQ